jgi:hypothetical protein
MLLGFLVFSIACANPERFTTPSSPTQTPSTVQPSPPPPPTAGEPLTGLAGTYLFNAPISATYKVSDYTRASKYVLQDSGAFSLQYPTGAELVGTYRLESGRITFAFGGSFDGATGKINGDLLEVRYGDRMEQSDFESAVYRRSTAF